MENVGSKMTMAPVYLIARLMPTRPIEFSPCAAVSITRPRYKFIKRDSFYRDDRFASVRFFPFFFFASGGHEPITRYVSVNGNNLIQITTTTTTSFTYQNCFIGFYTLYFRSVKRTFFLSANSSSVKTPICLRSCSSLSSRRMSDRE